MKKNLYLAGSISLIVFEICCMACSGPSREKARETETDTHNPFREYITTLDDSAQYAVVEIGGVATLLVTHDGYAHTSPDHQTVINAIEAQVYSTDSTGQLISHGEVRTQGTAYPLAIADGKLVLAGHHYIETYSFTGSQHTFSLIEDAYEIFDEQGNISYSYDDIPHNITLRNCPETRFDSLMNIQDRWQVIRFCF